MAGHENRIFRLVLCVLVLCSFAMLSSEERRLIAGILALLLFGAVVDALRSRVVSRESEKVVLPSALLGQKGFTRE